MNSAQHIAETRIPRQHQRYLVTIAPRQAASELPDHLVQRGGAGPELNLGDEDLTLRDPQVDIDLADPAEGLRTRRPFEYRIQVAEEDIVQALLC